MSMRAARLDRNSPRYRELKSCAGSQVKKLNELASVMTPGICMFVTLMTTASPTLGVAVEFGSVACTVSSEFGGTMVAILSKASSLPPGLSFSRCV